MIPIQQPNKEKSHTWPVNGQIYLNLSILIHLFIKFIDFYIAWHSNAGM